MLLNMDMFGGKTEVLGKVRRVSWEGDCLCIKDVPLDAAKEILMLLFTGKLSVSEPVRSLEVVDSEDTHKEDAKEADASTKTEAKEVAPAVEESVQPTKKRRTREQEVKEEPKEEPKEEAVEDTTPPTPEYDIDDEFIDTLNEESKVRGVIGAIVDKFDISTQADLLKVCEQVVSRVPKLQRAADLKALVERVGEAIGIEE